MTSTSTSLQSSIRRASFMAMLLLGCVNAWAAQPPSSSPALSKRSHATSSSTSSPTQLPVSYASATTTTTTTSIPKWNLPTLNGRQSSSSSTSAATANLQRKRRLDRSSQQQQPAKSTRTAVAVATTRYRVYCDLDGVLVDFESGIRQLFPDEFQVQQNLNVDDLHRSTMWRRVAAAPSFFEHLPWTRQGRVLWQAIAPLKPDILTGVPVAHASTSCVEKYKWCARELGVPVIHHDKVLDNSSIHSWTTRARKLLSPPQAASENDENNSDSRHSYTTRVITCWSRDKYLESGENAVLIDDRIELRHDWEAAGGTFIHHNGNVHETIQKLRQAGILPHEQEDRIEDQHHQQQQNKNTRDMWP